jgi:hypothetical protein
VSAYPRLSSEDWKALSDIWARLALDSTNSMFDDPKKSFFHFCQSQRRLCFYKAVELGAGLRTHSENRIDEGFRP